MFFNSETSRNVSSEKGLVGCDGLHTIAKYRQGNNGVDRLSNYLPVLPYFLLQHFKKVSLHFFGNSLPQRRAWQVKASFLSPISQHVLLDIPAGLIAST